MTRLSCSDLNEEFWEFCQRARAAAAAPVIGQLETQGMLSASSDAADRAVFMADGAHSHTAETLLHLHQQTPSLGLLLFSGN